MSKHILYAYVDGFDLENVEKSLANALGELIESRSWICPAPFVVNQRHPRDESMQPDDLPQWELGLNMTLPDPTAEPNGWFDDVEAIALCLGKLFSDSGREFIIGIGDTETGTSNDLFFVQSELPNLTKLRQIIGVGPNG